jgi:hypothetical protein
MSFSCASQRQASLVAPPPLFSLTDVNTYRLRIKTPQVEMSGVMMVKYMDNEWRGSLINEFGVKAFDFIVKKQKCRLLNTVSLLNRWYIRKTIERDLFFLFGKALQGEVEKGRRITYQPDGFFIITNERQHIDYIFQPMIQ